MQNYQSSWWNHQETTKTMMMIQMTTKSPPTQIVLISRNCHQATIPMPITTTAAIANHHHSNPFESNISSPTQQSRSPMDCREHTSTSSTKATDTILPHSTRSASYLEQSLPPSPDISLIKLDAKMVLCSTASWKYSSTAWNNGICARA